MKMVRSKVLALAGAAVLAPILLFAAVTADHAHSQGDFSQHLAQKLGLSAEQTQQVQGVFANHKAELNTEVDRLKTAKTALFEAVHADTFDESAVRAAAANVAQVEADLAVTRAKMASEVRSVLTPDQQAKAKEMLANHRDRAQKWGDRAQHHMNGMLDGSN
jgi:Spy/CpxP family protein refolding chaperone